MTAVAVVPRCSSCGGSLLVEADGESKCMSCGRVALAVAEPEAASWLDLCKRDLREVLAEISRLEAEYAGRVVALKRRAEVDRRALLAVGAEASRLPWRPVGRPPKS